MESICLVNGVFPPHEYGGAENYVFRVASALQERGYQVSILTTQPYDGPSTLKIQNEEYKGISVNRFYPLNISHRSEGTGENIFSKGMWHQFDTLNPHANKIVSRFLRRECPDVVHTNNFMGISATVGKAIAESEARYVHMLHDYSLLCPKSNLLRERTLPGDEVGVCNNPPTPCQLYASAKRRAIGQPDLILSPSQHVIDVHRKHGFFNGIPTIPIQHGVREVAEETSFNSPNKSVLFVGKHLRAKGLETLFAAAEKISGITIHVCGTGPFDEVSKTAAAEHENIKYHGFVSDEKLHELRQSTAAAIVPSLWMENSPLVIYESFAEGLPVIGADIGGIPELVDESRGSLFQSGNPEALAECVQEMINGSQEYRRLQQNALSWAQQHTMANHIDQLIEYYKP